MASLLVRGPTASRLHAVVDSPPSWRASSPTLGQDWATYAKGKGTEPYLKPWADQPWPLIETPGRTRIIAHPAHHIADEIAQIHNAMLRGLNALFLQAPHIHKAQDVADLLFLTQSWAAWILDHHDLKEGVILPEFEAILGLRPGTLTLARTDTLRPSGADSGISRGSRSSSSSRAFPPTPDSGVDLGAGTASSAKSIQSHDKNEEERVSAPLRQIYSYAVSMHRDIQSYDATAFQSLLACLAETLVPHLTNQVNMLLGLREMCFATIPVTTNTPPPETQSSPNRTSYLSPETSSKSKSKSTLNSKSGTDAAAASRQRKEESRALWEADARATKLLQSYVAAEGCASAAMDSFVVLPMIVRLRDSSIPSFAAIASSGALPPSPPQSSRSSTTGSSGSRSNSRISVGIMARGGAGGGLGVGGEWPKLSVLALHAVADKLSPRHAGAWRFLPCDVWGRPKELEFLGC
ncbi:hypothetical protein F5Y16DRAFT_123048 [Xylariaceae sp. FL0255]|nr:hypothetical protein F5Y16DRAFT_123048 [Xylariaceae sp. FL0255]